MLRCIHSPVTLSSCRQCIEGKLKGKTRVLVTHKLDILPACDKIVILEGGKIAHQGTYNELIAKGVNLGAVCAEYDDETAATETTGSGISKKADDLGSTPNPQTAAKTSDKGGDGRVEGDKGGKAGEEGSGPKIVRSLSVGQITEESRQKVRLIRDKVGHNHTCPGFQVSDVKGLLFGRGHFPRMSTCTMSRSCRCQPS